MILMIDNYDSFTYNLVQYLRELTDEVVVHRNDEITIEEIEQMQPAGIVISPGPSRPENAGVSLDVVKTFSGRIPLLGVCLGHQSICQAFGVTIIHAKSVMHGKTSKISTDGKGVFEGFTDGVQVMRYHSLAADEASLPDELYVTSRTADGEIMGVRHKTHMTEGVQFHPESIMTPEGMKMLGNFIKMCDKEAS